MPPPLAALFWVNVLALIVRLLPAPVESTPPPLPVA